MVPLELWWLLLPTRRRVLRAGVRAFTLSAMVATAERADSVPSLLRKLAADADLVAQASDLGLATPTRAVPYDGRLYANTPVAEGQVVSHAETIPGPNDAPRRSVTLAELNGKFVSNIKIQCFSVKF